ncbi:MAG: flagellar basal-body rod protein FlgG [Candidatus Tectomicrobia bacterium]|nr:flagellar basal-body rod protein FlgG [Candidatus Tectomicrobia bacterium]
MIRALWTAASGMSAQQFNIDIISNNLANVNTVGFKKGRGDFQDLLYQTLRPAGMASSTGTEVPTGIQIGHGVRPVAVQKLFHTGSFSKTDNPLDLLIEGNGFFAVTMPNGETAYSRAGAFKMDSKGRVVTSDGFPLDPEVTIPSNAVSFTVGTDGTVSVLAAGQTTPSEITKITLVSFPNPAGLSAIGRNLFKATAAAGSPVTGTPGDEGLGTIAQGALELSNVSVVDEMVNMISSQRAYELNSRVIQTADDMLQTANNVKR